MEIQLLGGASEVGRSAFLLKDSKNILLDYGVKIDDKTEYPMGAGRVDAYVLSHAHLDHSGYSPHLYRKHEPVAFCTEPTMRLSQLLIEDSLKIAKHNHEKPPFFEKQVHAFMQKHRKCRYGKVNEFHDYAITLHDAGHICGSSITEIEKLRTGRKLVYTGDFKLGPQYLQGPAEIVKSDILIIESTYAQREHPDRDQVIKEFIDNVKEGVDNGETVLVPCFAVGRSQEVLAILYKHGLIDMTYIDGMAKAATEIVMSFPDYTKNKELLSAAMKQAMWVGMGHQRAHALEGPSIVVTTSGMLNGGPVLDYITKLKPSSRIILTGYQAEDTNGRKLLENKPIIIDDKKYHIKSPVSIYDFSAHAGHSDLLEYVRKSNPETIVCVHGDEENSRAFADELKLEGFDASAPHIGEQLKVNF